MKTISTMKYLILSTMLIFSSCADDGDPGPKGDQGIAGVVGEKGDPGEEGPQGPAGTANVIYSEWLDFDWNISDESAFKSMAIEDAAITEDFFEDGGIVLSYLKGSSPDVTITTVMLPYISDASYMNASPFVLPTATPPLDFTNGMLVNLSSFDGVSAVDDYQDVSGSVDYDFRYILIPGGIKLEDYEGSDAGKSGKKNYDYETIARRFNIPD